ncbi:MAG: hypothetical protein GF329_04650, partial [Candidatus Lokiarchaeota archaeon]|nr:hypothetical protein [Candidatus Lokiarchaeota archaeon]
MEEITRMNVRKWVGIAILVTGVIMGFFSQYMPWHTYHNIYSLGGYDYQVIVFLQTSLLPALPIFSVLTYLPIIGAFIGLVACLLCLFPFSLKFGKLLGKISGIALLVGYIIYPIFYYLFGLIFSFFGLSFTDLFIPNMIGAWLCIGSFITTIIGSIVVPKSEILTQLEKTEGKKAKKSKKKSKSK